MRAGFTKDAMIEEGKRAAKFFKEKYGVDATGFPDKVYLAPNVTLEHGITFSFFSLPPSAGLELVMASKRDKVQFYNSPGSFSVWNLKFSKDYVSTGTFNGTIPKGASVVFGSEIFDTCPYESYYNPCYSMLSDKPRGRVFVRVYSTSFIVPVGLITVTDLMFENARLTKGRGIGVMTKYQTTGITIGRAVVTFPATCGAKVPCYAKDRFHRRMRPRRFDSYW